MTQLPPLQIDPETFLHQHCELPPLPPLVRRVQSMCRDSDTHVRDVVELISSDPALVAQILKVVNSAYYGLPQEVSKLQFAVVFLGLNEIYRLVLSLSVIDTLSVRDARELAWFWQHSYFTALCVRLLAKEFEPHIQPDELWSAAILHDIGKLIYLRFFPEHFTALREHCRSQGCLFSQAEQQLQLPASSYLGGLLCEHWQLPELVGRACRTHSLHDLADLAADSLQDGFLRMICTGNLLAVLVIEELSEDTKRTLVDAVAAALQISQDRFLALMGRVYELQSDLESFLARIRP